MTTLLKVLLIHKDHSWILLRGEKSLRKIQHWLTHHNLNARGRTKQLCWNPHESVQNVRRGKKAIPRRNGMDGLSDYSGLLYRLAIACLQAEVTENSTVGTRRAPPISWYEYDGSTSPLLCQVSVLYFLDQRDIWGVLAEELAWSELPGVAKSNYLRIGPNALQYFSSRYSDPWCTCYISALLP